MTVTAAEIYAARVDAWNAQQVRLFGARPADPYGSDSAPAYRFDPHRKPGPNLEVLASYVRPDNVVVDVGGGAGRVGLPLALRCRELVNVEPAPAIGAEFLACAAEAGITNVRLVKSGWLEAEGLDGDVCMAVGVLDWNPGLRAVVPFTEKLMAASRRRVILSCITHAVRFTASDPAYVEVFAAVYGEEPERYPDYRELLPILWEMGILPEVRVLPNPPGEDWPWQRTPLRTREEAVQMVLRFLTMSPWMAPVQREQEFAARARELVDSRLDDFFQPCPEGFLIRPPPQPHELLITWETGQQQ